MSYDDTFQTWAIAYIYIWNYVHTSHWTLLSDRLKHVCKTIIHLQTNIYIYIQKPYNQMFGVTFLIIVFIVRAIYSPSPYVIVL